MNDNTYYTDKGGENSVKQIDILVKKCIQKGHVSQDEARSEEHTSELQSPR